MAQLRNIKEVRCRWLARSRWREPEEELALNWAAFALFTQDKLCSASQQPRDPKGRIFLSARNRFSLNMASLQQTGGGGGLRNYRNHCLNICKPVRRLKPWLNLYFFVLLKLAGNLSHPVLTHQPPPKIAQHSILLSSVSPTYQQIWRAEYFGDYSNYLHKYFIIHPKRFFLTLHPLLLTKRTLFNL